MDIGIMKQFASAVILMFVLFLSACSFGYEVVIVNESDKPIQIRYKISEKGQFDQPMVKVLEDWNERKKNLVTKEYINIALEHLRDYGSKLNFA